MRNSEKKGIVHEISQEFILDVSPYVEDMRILQNIYNEFVVYKETIRTDQDLNLSDETMMALIILKLYHGVCRTSNGERSCETSF